MHHYCTIQNIMYLCSVIKKQRLQEAAGASQSPANALSRYKKKRVLQEYPPGKRKIKLSFVVLAKNKDTFFFPFPEIIQKEKRSLTSYY